jgi:DNA ligase-1
MMLIISTDVRKCKQWQDAEYIVTGVDVSRQRLAVDGTFGEYEAVAAVHIRHKGHHVAVGSGLTADQRIRWAKDPSEIVSYLKALYSTKSRRHKDKERNSN